MRTEGRRARPSESITIEYGMWSFDPVRKDGKGILYAAAVVAALLLSPRACLLTPASRIDSTARGPMTLRVEQGTVVAGIYEALMLVDGGASRQRRGHVRRD